MNTFLSSFISEKLITNLNHRLNDRKVIFKIQQKNLLRDLGEKGKGIKKSKLELHNNHRDGKYSIGNTVSNLIITVYGVRWELDLSGCGTLYKLYKCLSTRLYT